jgi:hypothetical protein
MASKRPCRGQSRQEETATEAPTDADGEQSHEESENKSNDDPEPTPLPLLTEEELPSMDIKHLDTLSLEELQQLRDQTAQEAILAEVKCEIQMNQAWIQHAEAPIEAQGPIWEKNANGLTLYQLERRLCVLR